VRVESPPQPQLWERQQDVERRRVQSSHRPDLDEPGLTGHSRRVTTRHIPCRVRSPAVGGLRQPQLKALGQEHEHVEELARERDIVIDDQQPVVARCRVRLEQFVEVLELALAADRSAGELELVVRTPKLLEGTREQIRLRSLDPQHQDPPLRPGASRMPQAPRP
jgi:hypothetical protein